MLFFSTIERLLGNPICSKGPPASEVETGKKPVKEKKNKKAFITLKSTTKRVPRKTLNVTKQKKE